MTLRRALLLPLALLALLVVLEASADDGAPRRLAFRAAQEPLRDRDWPAAAKALRAFRTAHPVTAEASEAWVLEIDALLEA
ncbi:MAG: hypothetical protein O2894_13180, partial [Planctomycetota bacterium]|nr:hypothetical protein [Planctomycetota bacterium]